MADRFQVLFDGQPAGAAFYQQLASLEVEENADLPGAFEMQLPIAVRGAPGAEDLTAVGEAAWKPYARIAVVVTPDGGTDACIFDGYVLSHKLHLDRGTTASTLRVWGQDVSCEMNVKERLKRWDVGKKDHEIANDIFGTYSYAKADENTDNDAPARPDTGHAVMQRATDAQFLRDRARRSGKLFRVCCEARAGANTGYFARPKLDGAATATIVLNPPEAATVDALDLEWDIARPTRTYAHVLVGGEQPEAVDTTDAKQRSLGDRSLAQFAGGSQRAMEARLTTTADSNAELTERAAALLRDSTWFVRCEGVTDLARQRAVLRAAKLVELRGAGRVHSGKYLVWSVRHTITAQAHQMRFVLVRNAVGNP